MIGTHRGRDLYRRVAGLALALAWLTAASARGAEASATTLATNLATVAAPELIGQAWLNGAKNASLSAPSLKGKVTILHFWTFDCINCRHNLPYYQRWQRAFPGSSVQIIGIHTPETERERAAENVAQKVKDLAITYPVLLDPQRENWNRWQQRIWPAIYLVDKRGHVRYVWEGELEYQGAGGYAKMTRLIEALARE